MSWLVALLLPLFLLGTIDSSTTTTTTTAIVSLSSSPPPLPLPQYHPNRPYHYHHHHRHQHHHNHHHACQKPTQGTTGTLRPFISCILSANKYTTTNLVFAGSVPTVNSNAESSRQCEKHIKAWLKTGVLFIMCVVSAHSNAGSSRRSHAWCLFFVLP